MRDPKVSLKHEGENHMVEFGYLLFTIILDHNSSRHMRHTNYIDISDGHMTRLIIT